MMTKRTKMMIGCGLMTSAALTGQVYAQDAGPAPLLSDYVLFGVSGSSSELVRYQFADRDYRSVGQVHFTNGSALSGIEGMAYVPGHLNIFGFWSDPAADETRLVYINTEDATASIIGQSLGPGKVTGATMSWKDQQGELDGGAAGMTGLLNINPNNSSANEFILTKTDGTKITRDDLHQNAPITSGGVLYEGPAEHIRVRPKGNNNQNQLTVGGVTYPVYNNHTYVMAGGTMSVRIYNDQVSGSGKAMGHWWVEFLNSGSAVIHEAGENFGFNGLFAIQKVEAQEEEDVDFVIQNGQVIPQEDYAVKVSVIGAAITAGGTYDIPVTVHVNIGAEVHAPFDDFDKPVDGNVNDNYNPRKFIPSTIYPAGTPVSVDGRSWIKKKSWYSGNSNNHWISYLTVYADEAPPNVLVLRNGDPIPDIEPFMNQDEILDIIIDYVDHTTGTIVLDENQAIYLYELGTTNLASDAADFQDLVVLVTLAKDPIDLQREDDDDDDVAGIASRIIKVDPDTGGFEQIMTLNRVYDSLAATPQGVFLGTNGSQLYALNPFEQTETLVGSMTYGSVKGFENADTIYCGFTTSADKLINWERTGSLGSLHFEESGWFIVRVVADNPKTFRFASTAPFYVEVGRHKTRVSRSAAQFFLDWVRERIARIAHDDPKKLEEVLAVHRSAEKFWSRRVRHANAE